MVGWATPTGTTKIVSKRKDPVWTPPASVRKEHAAEGDILPARVPAGPDNPLGAFAMNLGWPSYLMHGTNKPAGVGMRASHGCIRLYPEDIATLFETIPVGTKVTVVNQPLAVSRRRTARSTCNRIPPHEEHPEAKQAAAQGQRFGKKLQDKMFQRAKQDGVIVDWALVGAGRQRRARRGRAGLAAGLRLTTASWHRRGWSRTRFPTGSTWDGSDRPVPGRRRRRPPARRR